MSSTESVPLCFAYYCSGHGYGHATRVSAFAGHLLRRTPRPAVHIVSSAPAHVFADSIALGALYRRADIDPVIVQPLAYRVDREASVAVLEAFLADAATKVSAEAAWLRAVQADCVLSDAAFLGCLAANHAHLPSVLITNFSFDAVYSYLGTPVLDVPSPSPPSVSAFPSLPSMSSFPSAPASSTLAPPPAFPQAQVLPPDVPIPAVRLDPLVAQLHAGYRCADRLLRLPGYIPLPSFVCDPPLPAPTWITPDGKGFTREVLVLLDDAGELLPSVPFAPFEPDWNSGSPFLSPNSSSSSSSSSSLFSASYSLSSASLPPDSSPSPSPSPPASTATPELLPPAPRQKPLPRSAHSAPLLVRSPDPAVYTPAGRARLLATLGVPPHAHDPARTRVLVVSFGGQVFHRPANSRAHSRTHSRAHSVAEGAERHGTGIEAPHGDEDDGGRHAQALADALQSSLGISIGMPRVDAPVPVPASMNESTRPPKTPQMNATAFTAVNTTTTVPPGNPEMSTPRITTNASATTPKTSTTKIGRRPRAYSQLLFSGAPPVTVSLPTSPAVPTLPVFRMMPPTPERRGKDPFEDIVVGTGDAMGEKRYIGTVEEKHDEMTESDGLEDGGSEEEEEITQLLPDESWIAVVCGVEKNWGQEGGEVLPDGFYVAPKDVYMPDLTAVADVLLGKLGYGTVSECVDACTPFVYVPRPLFVEEHGLRLLLERDGVGVELSRTAYEVGEWAEAVETAWQRGRAAKERKRQEGETGRRHEEGRVMAQELVDWVGEWKRGSERC